MKVIQTILFTFALVAGLSVAAFAQKDDPKKPPPPKEKPPVVVPQPKNPQPKETPRPIKPESIALWKPEIGETA